MVQEINSKIWKPAIIRIKLKQLSLLLSSYAYPFATTFSISSRFLETCIRPCTVRIPVQCLILRSRHDIFFLPIPLLPSIFPSIISCNSWYLVFRIICPKYAVFFFFNYFEQFSFSADSSEDFLIRYPCRPWFSEYSTVNPHFKGLYFIDSVQLSIPYNRTDQT